MARKTRIALMLAAATWTSFLFAQTHHVENPDGLVEDYDDELVQTVDGQKHYVTVHANGNLRIGGTGQDPRLFNKQGAFIFLQAGSTLIVTNINNAHTIWSGVCATNGAAILQAPGGLNIDGHLLTFGAGSLTVENAPAIAFGHSTQFPVLDAPNLSIEGGGSMTVDGCFLRRLPTSIACGFTGGCTLHVVCDFLPAVGETSYALPARNIIVHAGSSALSGMTLDLSQATSVSFVSSRLADYVDFPTYYAQYPATRLLDATAATNFCSFVFKSGQSVSCDNTQLLRFDGELSGVATLTAKSSDLAFAGANASFGGTVRASDGVTVEIAHATALAAASVELASGATLSGAADLPAVSVAALAGTDFTSLMRAAANQTLTIASPTGALRAVGAGSASVVALGTVPAGLCVAEDGSVSVTYAGRTVRADSVTQAAADGSFTGWIAPDLMVADVWRLADAFADIPADDPVIPPGIVPGTSGARTVDPAGETVHLGGSGTYTLVDQPAPADWTNSVTLWFDFSRKETIRRVSEGSTIEAEKWTTATISGHPELWLFERIVDWRRPDSEYALWNRVLYNSATGYYYPHTFPVLDTTGTDGGLSFYDNGPVAGETSNARRLPLAKGTKSPCALAADKVIMVYNSARGGGHSLLSTPDGKLDRAGNSLDYPFTASGAYAIRTNGVAIAADVRPNGGWQILTIDLAGGQFRGLGFTSAANVGNSGQGYGEVLVFTSETDERTVLEAESYLAKKWNLPFAESARTRLHELSADDLWRTTNSVVVTGSAVINPDRSTLKLSGAFAGRVNLAGGNLVLDDLPIPTEELVPSDGRLYWVDPDDGETILYFGDEVPATPYYAEVRAIRDKSVRAFKVGEPALSTPSSRRPTRVASARAFGPARGWLDFNNVYGKDQEGNSLRFLAYVSDAAFATNLSPLAFLPVRTAFVVQDSVRGGGNPLLNAVSPAASVDRTLVSGGARRGDPTVSIWKGDAPAAFVDAGAENRLNGRIVDYRNGFTGGPELLTVRGTATASTSVIGNRWNSETNNALGEIIGEVILYSTALTDDQVASVETYLMNKWLGILPVGYTDVRRATIAGTGNVTVATGANRPKFASDYSGTVRFSDAAGLSFSIETWSGNVEDALVVPGATLDLPSASTVSVRFTSPPWRSERGRRYTLVSCAGFAHDVKWTLSAGANVPRGAYLTCDGTKLELVSPARNGMAFLLAGPEQTETLVLPEKFTTTARQKPREVMGRDYWTHLQTHYYNNPLYWKSETAESYSCFNPDLTNLAFNVDSSLAVFANGSPPSAGFTTATWRKVEDNTRVMKNRAEMRSRDKLDKPLVLNLTAKRNVLAMVGDVDLDYADWRAYKRAHPNLIATETDIEWGNDVPLLITRTTNILNEARHTWMTNHWAQYDMNNRYDRVKLQKWYFDRKKAVYYDDPNTVGALRGYYGIDHLATAWGARLIWVEVTKTGSVNEPYGWDVPAFFTRGAARQFQIPWAWYVAGYANLYTTPDAQGKQVRVGDSFPSLRTGGVGGTSASLLRRGWYYGFVNGANFVQPENCSSYFYVTNAIGKDQLSSTYGRSFDDYHNFTKAHPDRGTTYAPVAVLVPFAQGYVCTGGLSWRCCPYTDGDYALDALFKTISPECDYRTTQLAGWEYGEMHHSTIPMMFDVLVPDSPQKKSEFAKALFSYPAAILAGDHPNRAAFQDVLDAYVAAGGRLVEITSDMLPARGTLSDADLILSIRRGMRSGGAMRTVDTPPETAATAQFPQVYQKLAELRDEFFPFTVTGDCLYGANKTPDGWWIWVFNCKGVRKFADALESVDATKAASVHVGLGTIPCASVTELVGNASVPVSGNGFDFTVPAGDLAIFEIHTP